MYIIISYVKLFRLFSTQRVVDEWMIILQCPVEVLSNLNPAMPQFPQCSFQDIFHGNPDTQLVFLLERDIVQ